MTLLSTPWLLWVMVKMVSLFVIVGLILLSQSPLPLMHYFPATFPESTSLGLKSIQLTLLPSVIFSKGMIFSSVAILPELIYVPPIHQIPTQSARLLMPMAFSKALPTNTAKVLQSAVMVLVSHLFHAPVILRQEIRTV